MDKETLHIALDVLLVGFLPFFGWLGVRLMKRIDVIPELHAKQEVHEQRITRTEKDVEKLEAHVYANGGA